MPFLSLSFGPSGFGFDSAAGRIAAGAFTPSVNLLGGVNTFDVVAGIQRSCARFRAGDPTLQGSFSVGSAVFDRQLFCDQVDTNFPISEATRMSFIGDLIGGIGDAAKAIGGGLASAAGAVVGALPSVAQGAAAAASAIQAIQMSLSGNPTLPINPTTGSPMPMPAMMVNPLSQYSAALAAECGAMPTPQCGANFDARLQAFTAALGGSSMTMPINPMTGTPGVVGAGVATDLLALARQGLMNPNVVAALRAVGLGGLIGAGEAGVTALANAAFGGGSSVSVPGVRGPLLMSWPAGTPYPRGIVLRAPDKPEKGYRSKGSALLLSGDVAAVRRVQKAATRARRRRGSTRASARTVYALPAPGAHHVCGSCLSSPCGCK